MLHTLESSTTTEDPKRCTDAAGEDVCKCSFPNLGEYNFNKTNRKKTALDWCCLQGSPLWHYRQLLYQHCAVAVFSFTCSHPHFPLLSTYAHIDTEYSKPVLFSFSHLRTPLHLPLSSLCISLYTEEFLLNLETLLLLLLLSFNWRLTSPTWSLFWRITSSSHPPTSTAHVPQCHIYISRTPPGTVTPSALWAKMHSSIYE